MKTVVRGFGQSTPGNIVVSSKAKETPPEPEPNVHITHASTNAVGTIITATFSDSVTGSVTGGEFGISSDQAVFSVVQVNVTDGLIDLTLDTAVTPTDTNVVISYTKTGDSNIDDFVDHVVINIATHQGTLLDLDHDGKPDTLVARFGDVTISEDEDSINIDLNGDGDADIEIPKP